VPATYAAADLLARLPTGTTTWLVHGDQDNLVPPRQSVRYAERARAASDDSTVFLLAGQGHFGVIDPADPAFASWSARLVAWARP
jgi:acetyl esterase/lipase